ncbi:MAG: hypothetical protein JNG88_12500 [Phycisphaerales bacterium]|nr:hypothetical protein [Phycisphaerales bacterium]
MDSRTRHALELTARFAEARQQVLAENVANIDTPDYHSRTLDAGVFRDALRAALDENDGSDLLSLRGGAQVRTDAAGRLQVDPTVESAPNVLFHDGTNARMESLMSQAAENGLLYNLTTSLLRSKFDSLTNAIRGRIA